MAEETPQDQDTQLAVALYDYRRAVRATFGYIDVQKRGNFENVSKIEIGRQFVFPQLSPRHISPREEPSAWGETTPLLTALKEFPTLTVLGDPGSGKSTIVAWIAQMLADPGPNIYKTTFPGVVPIPMILRDLRLEGTDGWQQLVEKFIKEGFADGLWERLLAAFIAQEFAKDLTLEQVRRLLADGRAFVLVDGLDEVSDPDMRMMVRNGLLEGQLLSEGNRWVFTSRIVGYTVAPVYAPGSTGLGKSIFNPVRHWHEIAEIGKAVLETGEPPRLVSDLIKAANHPNTLRVETPLRYVTPFLPDAVAQFAKNWFNLREPEPANAVKRAKDFLDALGRRTDLSEMARTPQLLGMMCLVHYYQATLPDGRAELYQSVVRAYLIDIPRIIGRDISVDPEYRLRWLSAIGFQLQLRRTATEEVTDDAGVTVSEATLKLWLKEIDVDDDKIEDFVRFLGHRAGLLLPRGTDEAGNEVYAFLHLSFQEYFAARYLAERDPTQPRSSALASLDLSKSSKPVTVPSAQFLRWSRDPVWQETFRLLFQIYGPSQADNLAGELFTEFQRLVGGVIDGKADDVLKRLQRFFGGENENQQKHASAVVGYLGVLLSDVVMDGKSRISSPVRRGLWERLIELEFQSQASSNRRRKSYNHKYSITDIISLLSLALASGEYRLPSQLIKTATVLDLWYVPITDLEPLRRLTEMTMLNLTGTQVKDLEPIKGLNQLAWLYLTGTFVSDIEPLKGLKNLKVLALNNTSIKDLRPIKGLIQLQGLNLSGTLADDIEPLRGLTQLRTLYLGKTRITDGQRKELKKHLPKLRIIG